MVFRSTYYTFFLSLILCLGVVACGEENTPVTYQTEKEPFLAVPTWKTPKNWLESDITHIAQLAVFRINEASSASLSTLQGNGGGVEANVNRWRRQLGLLPIPGEQIKKESREVGRWTLVKLLDDKKERGIFGAIYQTPRQTFFAKLSADVQTLNNEAESFLQFIASIELEEVL
jgi:hypothetical protein